MRRFAVFVGLLALVLSAGASAQLQIEINQGVDNPTPIAVVPFGWQGVGTAPDDVARIIDSDLARSGQFAPVSRRDMLSFPDRASDIYFRDWRALSSEYVLIGRVSGARSGDGPVRIEYQLFDAIRQLEIDSGTVSGSVQEIRMLAHQIADAVYERLTGIPGAFATRLLYVSVTRNPNGKDFYRLVLSDADGARPIVLFEGRDPIMAPSWSPDGSEVAYVSFETSRPAIYRQNLRTGVREQLTNFKGLNNSPVWSPDGNSMAMVLSKDGSPDIYLMNLASKKLRRLTRHYAIDTEPTWMPDGRSLLFTSDRGGRPQIYRYDLSSGQITRVTFEGSYNARARVAQDGRNVALVHQQNGQYHIAVHDLVTSRLTILTSTSLDESPSIAPNGSIVLYATKRDDKGILGAVAVDGGVRFSLPARDGGHVQEPAWSPYFYR
ncbi:Tol-Pal system beta propeller repeat protein TolB [Luminiphilus syltensis NOR5-1B]|uniref:Tol-Pal system protein TolB n=1 Tax=Luminiphilus syltensis NOR5-1B TaxID=565045 RepID=B8KS60_9GAMM|nr:Tol-Pal system beta propeller repeat protein TolB [Luminiphilus syltensis]EED36538.1 Tol-Pal system beta propeller repeat protein TolB [Luminiphilus syltensis NOR5-1B]